MRFDVENIVGKVRQVPTELWIVAGIGFVCLALFVVNLSKPATTTAAEVSESTETSENSIVPTHETLDYVKTGIAKTVETVNQNKGMKTVVFTPDAVPWEGSVTSTGVTAVTKDADPKPSFYTAPKTASVTSLPTTIIVPAPSSASFKAKAKKVGKPKATYTSLPAYTNKVKQVAIVSNPISFVTAVVPYVSWGSKYDNSDGTKTVTGEYVPTKLPKSVQTALGSKSAKPARFDLLFDQAGNLQRFTTSVNDAPLISSIIVFEEVKITPPAGKAVVTAADKPTKRRR